MTRPASSTDRIPLAVGLALLLAIRLCSPWGLSAAETAGGASTIQVFFSKPVSSDTLARIPAVATYVDPIWKLLFAQDDTGGCLIIHSGPNWSFAPGDRILIEGHRTEPAATNPVHVLRNATIRRTGEGKRPKPVAMQGADLGDRAFEARWVGLRGKVRSIVELSRLQLFLESDGKILSVWVRHYSPTNLVGLLDAEVSLQAVCNQEQSVVTGRSNEAHFLTDDFSLVRIDRAGPAQPFHRPRTSIAELQTQAAKVPAQERLLVRGRVIDQEQGFSLKLRDETGEILLLTPSQITLARDEMVEAIGWRSLEEGQTVLKHAELRRVEEDAATSPSRVLAAQADARLPTLKSIKQILELPRGEAKREYPLQVTGVVTFFAPPGRALFLQDGDDAIFVGLMSQLPSVKAGHLVEVFGVTKPGGVLPMISPARIVVLGDSDMPPSPLISYREGMSGAFDCRRVAIQGVVQSTAWIDEMLNIDLVAEDGRFWCTLRTTSDSPLRTNLVNAHVELRGVCVVGIDNLGAPNNLQIEIQQESDIRIKEDAPQGRNQIQATPIAEAQGFLPPAQANRRLRIQGKVTYWRPGFALYIQDATGAIVAQTDQTDQVDLGDEVEVTGFRASGEDGFLLRSAEYRVLGKGREPAPVPLRAGEALSPVNRGKLVRIEARLRKDVSSPKAPELLLEDGGELFTATLDELGSEERSPDWRAGSLLSVTGICVQRLDESKRPRAFRLMLRNLADVAVLESPPWFTTSRIVALLLLLAAAVLIALAWIRALRRRVSEQTETIRKRLESEAATERRLALVWEASADGMRMTDGEGIVVQVNDAYCQMTQKNRTELEGRSFLDAFRAENVDALATEYRNRFERKEACPRREIEMILWNGQTKWFEVVERFIEHTNSSPLLLGQFKDITKEKLAEAEQARLQEQLSQAQRTESIGRLAGGVAHDFNNMLQVILGNTALALEETPAGSPLHQAMREIHHSAERSAELTRQLLAFARKQTISPKILDLNEAVASLLKMLQRLIGENIQLIWIPGGDLWPVKIDPAQVDQILVNLCVNSRDAIPETGKITIRTSKARVGANQALAHPDREPGEYVVLSIADTGQGIEASIIPNLFEPFFTTKKLGKGTGLGLATVFGIVKQNGGFIEVQSEPNQGALFSIYLPRCETPVSVAVPAESKAPVRGSETILLVEDDEQILNLARRSLTQNGYRVLAAQSPELALERARQHIEPIDLLITDVIMPGMNGKQLRQKVQTLRPGIRCIYMSGYTADVIAHQGILESDVDCLQKPFSVQVLARKVREVLDRTVSR